MEINWLGQSAFRIKGKQTTVVIDPFLTEKGDNLNRVAADILCFSYQDPSTDAIIAKIRGEPYIIRGPGEYEVGSTFVIGIPTYQDDNKGSIRGNNTVYTLEIEEISVCHLGRLGHILDEEQIETIGNVDVLLVPVGGNMTINASTAAKLMRTMEPKVVIPMHYKTSQTSLEIDPVDKFLSETGSQGVPAQPKISITRNNLPQSTQVMLLEDRS
jgi:L-ascorbate metabolism protein UlaG (beta-lactamase superfamily)